MSPISFGATEVKDSSQPTLAQKRQNQFMAGRQAALNALQAAGGVEHTVNIKRSENGAPQFPAGFTGSISHTDTWAVSAVSSIRRFPEIYSIGIDIENKYEKAARVKKKICTFRELQLLESSKKVSGDLLSTIVFSAKESFYKATASSLSIHPGFQDVSLDLEKIDMGDLQPSFLKELKQFGTPDQSSLLSFSICDSILEKLSGKNVHIEYAVFNNPQFVVCLTVVTSTV